MVRGRLELLGEGVDLHAVAAVCAADLQHVLVAERHMLALLTERHEQLPESCEAALQVPPPHGVRSAIPTVEVPYDRDELRAGRPHHEAEAEDTGHLDCMAAHDVEDLWAEACMHLLDGVVRYAALDKGVGVVETEGLATLAGYLDLVPVQFLLAALEHRLVEPSAAPHHGYPPRLRARTSIKDGCDIDTISFQCTAPHAKDVQRLPEGVQPKDEAWVAVVRRVERMHLAIIQRGALWPCVARNHAELRHRKSGGGSVSAVCYLGRQGR
mmetsp:Transcript_95551/g.275918  ORF Transcript_95551/g.275918 Transcript_95551/m.275918 type:complete len:269 (-) Transcript_95551:15-821(-)